MSHSKAPLGRRQFLRLGLAAGSGLLVRQLTFAAVPQPGAAAMDARLVFIILRGALDGLAAVPAYGDPDYAARRAQLAIAPPGGADGALALDTTFGLNPGLRFLHESYGRGEALVFHAVATAYRDRSHFDGQDVLETGLGQPHASRSGWLNRALLALPADAVRGAERGVALGANVPLVLRGSAPIASWSSSKLPVVDDDTLQRIADRYASDPLLSQRLAAALATDAIAEQADAAAAAPEPVMSNGAQGAGPAAMPVNAAWTGAPAAGEQADMNPSSGATLAVNGRPRAGAERYVETVRTAAEFIRRDDGPRVAVFDTIGWDTHFNEGGARGQLTQRLAALDTALAVFKQSLGPVWSRTVVLMATEFGRTVATNGTSGTDHGTGAAAFLVGGAVNGGRVVADWPGLSTSALYQARDLRPTLDVRSVMKSVLHDHLRISTRSLDEQVFPQGRPAYIGDLIRA